MIAGPTRPDKT